MSTNTLLFGVLFLLTATCVFFIVRVELRLRKLFRGSRAQDLESLMADIAKEVDTLGERAGSQEKNQKSLESKLARHGRGVKLVRFNPFGEAGSNQSFAAAFMNTEGDGIVFSSLYSRDRMSVFAKQITSGKSEIELTPEEASVIKEAQKEAME